MTIGDTHIAILGADQAHPPLAETTPTARGDRAIREGFARYFDRMMTMAEHLQTAQIEGTKRAQDYLRTDARRGHWLGFASTVLAIVAAAGVTIAGYPRVGKAPKPAEFASGDGRPPARSG
jgi:hypothetical protein